MFYPVGTLFFIKEEISFLGIEFCLLAKWQLNSYSLKLTVAKFRKSAFFDYNIL